MTDPAATADLLRMLRQHVDSLRSAGVEWITVQPQPSASAAVEAQPAEPAVSAPQGLFDQPLRGPRRSRAEKEAALRALNEGQVIGCPRCPVLVRNRTQTVFGVGNPDPDLVFVGEAPGADEDAQGIPFVGAAGQLLTRIIEACNLTRDEVYICNVIKCRPPSNRTPLPDEIANCFPFLEQQLGILQPKYICALGAVAAQALLKTPQSIGKLRGRFHDYRGVPVLCTYHPAYLLRNPNAKRDVWDDMKKLMSKMGRSVK